MRGNAASQGGELVVVLDSGGKIEVPEGFDELTLQRLVRVLETISTGARPAVVRAKKWPVIFNLTSPFGTAKYLIKGNSQNHNGDFNGGWDEPVQIAATWASRL